MALESGQMLLHYRLIEKIGEGGMGEVAPESTVLAGTEGAQQPFFSPDGEWLGFFAKGALKKISIRGGASLTLAECRSNRGGSWGLDDGAQIPSKRIQRDQ